MARILKNSRLNPKSPDYISDALGSGDASGAAAQRAHLNAKATGATTGQAGLEEGDAAKKAVQDSDGK